MEPKVRVTTNNDIAYLWWSVPEKIPGALGFSIHREYEDGNRVPLPAWVGFEKAKQGPRQVKDTDVWPIQSFQWKDVFAPRKAKVRYHIYVVKGTVKHPKRDEQPILTTPWVSLEEQFGTLRVVFNRGLLSTQAMNRGSNAPARNANKLRLAIADAKSKLRWKLGKELIPTLYELLQRAQAGVGKCYAALYELTDRKLIDELVSTATTGLVLSNANSSKTVDKKQKAVYDGTNAEVRQKLHAAKYGITDRMLKGDHIGHNKFVIYADAAGPSAVLTGSTNWTPTGLCGQTNNAILIEEPEIAAGYLDYWNLLQAEKEPLQGEALRTWTSKNTLKVPLNGASELKVWFSPNTQHHSKTKDEVPPDMKEVFEIIDGAKSMLLFLLFNPGQPSILQQIRAAEAAASKAGNILYVRGAISDAKTASEGAVNVYSRTAKAPDHVVTGVAGVPDDFGYWEKELLKLGHAAIHDKILVVDPFSKDCVVVTGSHNLGYKASFGNDENMVIIRGQQAIAQAYATHVLDIVNHYKWRYKLQDRWRNHKLNTAWQDLGDSDDWQNKYFRPGSAAANDGFVLANAGS